MVGLLKFFVTFCCIIKVVFFSSFIFFSLWCYFKGFDQYTLYMVYIGCIMGFPLASNGLLDYHTLEINKTCIAQGIINCEGTETFAKKPKLAKL